ncbi:hypothetical protein SAMN05444274_11525 [Mariniphaga anaerophila]|uniref:ATP-grasp domain-containing protein n=1 Tax=Mariniphaga anaerophila TaxID=1484053 RepID=A0A1M5FXG5_9BACT|nr:hypothetical protein [Mariniphaga anaerophila]SHF95862.1 hypothetical protein SAMN05444274_11525 [Mariniphaga anaerophila]
MKNLPDIYLYNPTCEYAIANGFPSWQPNRLLQKMEEDMGTLPLFFAKKSDKVLTKKIPPATFLKSLQKINIDPPQFLQLQTIADNRDFSVQPKNWLLPWGWSPAAHRILDPLKASCSERFQNSPVACWKPEYKPIYSKKFALETLTNLLPLLPVNKVLQSHLIPRVCTTKSEVETLIRRWGKIMIKAPWSSSGRGLQKVTKTPVIEKVWEKILGIVKDQGYVIVEPLLEKVLDMALQFRLEKGKISYLGVSRFLTDSKGQYHGNFLNGWPNELAPEITTFAESLPEMLVAPLTKVIENSKLAQYYEGNFGIDTLIFKDDDGNIRVNPCLEINVRQNMGLLSLFLEKLIIPNRKAVFKTFFEPGNTFANFKVKMENSHPLSLENSKIESGFFPITPAFPDTLFGGYILVSE